MQGLQIDDTLLLNKAPVTPASGVTRSWSKLTLPPELLAEASTRLGWAGLIYGSTYLLAYFGPYMTQVQGSYTPVQNWTAVVSIVMGFAVFAASRTAQLSPQTFLDFGIGFAIVAAFGIAVAEFAEGFTPTIMSGRYLGIPWECVWIIIYPLMAPNTPGKILIASLASAAAGPLTLWMSVRYFGAPINTPVSQLVIYFGFSSFLCVPLAHVMARIIIRYGVRLKKAREVGAYELVRTLGRGGMGEVWVARHRLLARPAAVKLIRPELMGSDANSREAVSRRFEREARATAQLRSTHTVDIYDFGRSEDGAFFYVMELLDGLSLDTLVKRHGPLSAERTVYILRQVCHSLGEAHKQGLIHRDIKPANIFLCRLGPDYDFVKVLDFGLVKHAGGMQQQTELTADGGTAGTPAYMAPEMATAAGDLDGRVDIYALGCVAYFMLTGHNVFDADTSIATILKHVRDTPVPPSERTEVAIPPALERLILDCLAKDPDGRPRTTADVTRRLAAIAFDQPWSCERGKEWWDIHRPPVIGY
jgi:tRNA A-37 threonylcarbamoyl transferase component Bud32